MATPYIQAGIVVGVEYKKNRSSDRTVIMLQVSFSDDDDLDVQSVQLFSQVGETYVPPIDTAVIVVSITPSFKIAIASDDGIDPTEIEEGERLLYSSDDTGEVKATLKLDVDGNVTINGGEDFAVRFSKLESAFNDLQGKWNDFISEYIPGSSTVQGMPAGVPPNVDMQSLADISEAKSETVLIP
jgi:hypothetical protein